MAFKGVTLVPQLMVPLTGKNENIRSWLYYSKFLAQDCLENMLPTMNVKVFARYMGHSK